MGEENIFFIKNFVDKRITEDINNKDTQKYVKELIRELQKIDDKDFIEIIISCFIPDTYKNMGKKEKLYTKLVEVVVADWWRRVGGTYNLPTKKSGTEDVELMHDNKSIVCDAKVFRLGRSQKAPNVKDFLKLASVENWIKNLKEKYKKIDSSHEILGGMVTYSSLHEWEGESEVYLECTNKKVPVVMISYEKMAFLLEYKEKYKLKELIDLWNYNNLFEDVTKSKEEYWKKIDGFLIELVGIENEEYNKKLEFYRKSIEDCVDCYKEIIIKEIQESIEEIKNKIDKISDIEELKQFSVKEIDKLINDDNYKYISNINNYRKY